VQPSEVQIVTSRLQNIMELKLLNRTFLVPNMRLQPTAQLAAKKLSASLASLAMPAQKSRIIQAILAPAMLGAPEALAVGRSLLFTAQAQTIIQKRKVD
jgi:hypothetical protein